jgi:asparagine synthase (glutamine-hydrolysing)
MGVKPLYYTQLPSGGLVFASELHALLKHPGVRPVMGIDGLVSYFFSDYAHPPTTMLAGVKKLAPGHYLLWRDGRVVIERPYWTLEVGSRYDSVPNSPDETLAESCWRRIGDAVENQLVADVPVGVLLSGGIDSSSVAVMARSRRNRDGRGVPTNRHQNIQTFSIGFDEKSFDESFYAAQVAKSIGAEHHQQTLGGDELLDLLDDALDSLDEPVADHAYLPMYALCKLASQHVKVVLSGDGGDELFGGYPTYKAHRYAELYRRVPSWIHSFLKNCFLPALPVSGRYQSLDWKLRHFIGGWHTDMHTRHLYWMANTRLEALRELLPNLEGRVPATLSTEIAPTDDPLNAMLALDFATYLPGSILSKVDRASMAHGLEVRPPFLDNELVQWCYRLPASKKMRGGTSKGILKDAAGGSLPESIINRPKRGFGMPVVSWLRGPLRFRLEKIMEESPLWDGEVLSHYLMKRWKTEHLEGSHDHSKALWALIVLDNWARRHQICGVAA